MKYSLSLCIIIICSTTVLNAQVGIDTTNPQAQLDVRSSNQASPSSTDGILIPKVDVFPTGVTINQDAMLVYLTTTVGTDTPGFYYYNHGTGWLPIGNGARIINDLIDGKSDNDGTEDGSSVFLGLEAGLNDDSTDNRNVGVGYRALFSNISGLYNNAIGYESLRNNLSGVQNIALGWTTLFSNIDGDFNIALGGGALRDNASGNSNIAIGQASSSNNISGSHNIAIGNSSLLLNELSSNNISIGQSALRDAMGSNNIGVGSGALESNTGDNNVAIGDAAGNASDGSGNVFLGSSSGLNASGGNKLYIENTSSASPLIYGEFDTDLLRINGTLDINNEYQFPTIDGNVNELLQTDGSGNVSWVVNPAIVTAENGLTETASVVRQGGPLTQNTTIDHGDFNLTYNLSNLGDFNIQDNGVTHLQVRDDGNTYFGGEAIVTASNDISGNTIARLFNIFGDEGALYLYRNGTPQHRIDAGFTTIFNDQGIDVDFRIESDTNPEAFGVDAGENLMYAGTDTVSLTNNGATVNGVTLEYVASFYRDDLTNGTAIQIGSTEYITDFGNLIIGPYGSWASPNDNTYDLGTSAFRWDDVYATSGVVNTSDIRLKKNIKGLNYGLKEIMRLEPISYQWKQSHNPSEVKIGFSAQQLLTVLPEVVKTHDYVYPNENESGVLQKNENLGVYYSDIIPVLTKAIQEQQKIIDDQNKLIKKLTANNFLLKEKDIAQDKSISEQSNSIEALVARLNVLESKSNH